MKLTTNFNTPKLPWQIANFATAELATIDECTMIASPICCCWLRICVWIMFHAAIKTMKTEALLNRIFFLFKI